MRHSKRSAQAPSPGKPPRGRVVRIEHVPRIPQNPKFRRRPPGPGAYTQQELDDWFEHHPDAAFAGGANLESGKRTRDKAYTPEALWKRGYYYAKTSVNPVIQQGQNTWETWLNDEGKGSVIDVFTDKQ
jgi:hypothetical protein